LGSVAKVLPNDRKTHSSQLQVVEPFASQVERDAAEGVRPLSAESLKAVKKRFTPDNIQKIREALNPPGDYDLEQELWIALYSYYRSYEPNSFDDLSPKQQTEKIAEVEHKAGLLLSLLREQPGIISDIMEDMSEVEHEFDLLLSSLRKQPGIISDIMDDIAEAEHEAGLLPSLLRKQPGTIPDIMDDMNNKGPFVDIEKCLERLIKGCQERKPELPKIKGGRHVEVGQREFFYNICEIHLEVTGRRATRKFYRLCYEALIGSISEENAARLATYTNREF
jgi:hypothetical protein